MKTLAKFSGLLCTTVAICSVASAASAGNLVTNGGFENPDVAAGTWSYFGGANDVPGWTPLDGSTIEIRDNKVGTAYEGDQFAEIDSHNYDKQKTVGFFQNIVTEIGKKYKLSFAYGPREQNNVNGDNLLKVLFGSIDENLDAGNNGEGWKGFSQTITATEATTTLQFELLGKYDTLGANIDAVHVTAVPEPLSLLGLAAIGSVGAVGVVRKRQAVQG
jgi:hypothetical protein